MIEMMTFWLLSIVEDDPIPYEISSIFFCHYKHLLFMGGCEYKPLLNYMFDYFPLEAQYFDCEQLHDIIGSKYYDAIVVDAINESFSNNTLKHEFHNKKIYYGEYGKKLKYLFTIK